MFLEKKVSAEATDEELSQTLDNLFNIRENLQKNKAASDDSTEIGSALDIKI